MKLNLDQLRAEIGAMTRKQAIYRLLRDELTVLGHWKAKQRGDPYKGQEAMKRKQGTTGRLNNP